MQKKRSIKIISVVLIIVLICLLITYSKNDSKIVLATTKEFNTENLQDNEHMHVEIDSSGDKVPVPNGYVGSKARGENEIDTGYVIYEGEEEVNDENVEEAQKTRNQYVWIPVPDASKMYGTDENGKKWGKLYSFATSSNNANYDEVTGTYPLNWNENNKVIKIDQKSNREPDVVIKNDYDIDIKLKLLGISTHDFLIQLEKEFNNMIKSVNKYGGFYIGRYETGDLSKNKIVIRKENSDINNQTYYTMYKKCEKIKENNTNVETEMIWGCQWDRTLMWLIESGDKTKEEICVDSTSWGNYYNSKFEYQNSEGKIETKVMNKSIKVPAGSTEYTKANNIYDLAGNVHEWTKENCINNYKTSRGGYYENNGINYNASYRYSYHGPSDVYGYRRMQSNNVY